jgi:hypothetical protein
MTHYVCTGGCKGVSEDPNAACLAEDCPKHAHPLTPCDCTDQQHEEAYAKDETPTV